VRGPRVDVVDAAAQIGIVHAREHRSDAVALQAQRIVGGIAPGADQLIEAGQQLRVIQQQRMQVQKFADLLRKCAVQAIAKGVHFAAHDRDRGVQALDFGIDLRRIDPFFGHIQRMRQAHARPAERAASRCAVTGEDSSH
jgi:hypothetical protein